MEEVLDKKEIAEKYNYREIWPISDHWHTYTHIIINKYVKRIFKKFSFNSKIVILNAGSGGNNYGLGNYKIIHVDIANEKIKKYPNYILSNIETIPVEKESIDVCICVGSVINYCNPERVLSEFYRILKPDSFLILEFEKTNSFDLILTEDFNRERAIVTTFYSGEKEKIWLFNEKAIRRILEMYFHIVEYKRFHMISPFVYKMTKNENISAKYAKLDPIIRFIPVINKYSSNIILTCRKHI